MVRGKATIGEARQAMTSAWGLPIKQPKITTAKMVRGISASAVNLSISQCLAWGRFVVIIHPQNTTGKGRLKPRYR